MIDFIKIRIPDTSLQERLLNDSRLTFKRVRGKQVSNKYRDLVFNITDGGTTEITGSLHKYFNNGEHNWNDFNRVDLWDTIQEICDELQIKPDQARIANIEIGVNLNVNFDSNSLLADLLCYKNKSFSKVPLPNNGLFREVTNSDYSVKCYDKARQYKKKEEILRFEIKVKKMRFLKSYQIHTLEDLQNEEKVSRLGELLLNIWDKVIIHEDLPESELSIKDQRIVKSATTGLGEKKVNRRERHEIKKKLNEVIMKVLTTTGRKGEIRNLISEKWAQLHRQTSCAIEQINQIRNDTFSSIPN